MKCPIHSLAELVGHTITAVDRQFDEGFVIVTESGFIVIGADQQDGDPWPKIMSWPEQWAQGNFRNDGWHERLHAVGIITREELDERLRLRAEKNAAKEAEAAAKQEAAERETYLRLKEKFEKGAP